MLYGDNTILNSPLDLATITQGYVVQRQCLLSIASRNLTGARIAKTDARTTYNSRLYFVLQHNDQSWSSVS
jgi:hypothetical protein